MLIASLEFGILLHSPFTNPIWSVIMSSLHWVLKSRQNHVFLFIFIRFLVISAVKSLKKLWNEQKRLKNGWKKCFNQLLGVRSTQKLVEIHNILLLCFFIFGLTVIIFGLFVFIYLVIRFQSNVPVPKSLWHWQPSFLLANV